MPQIPTDLPYKSLTILDPMDALPPLIFFVGDGEYSRSLVNRRSIRNRTSYGVGMLQGRLASPHFIWSYACEIVNRYQIELFEAYMMVQHRRSDRTAPVGTLTYILLADAVSPVPPEPLSETNYEFIPGTEELVMPDDPLAIVPSPIAAPGSYTAGYRTGYGIFRVWLSIDEKEYTSMLPGKSCKSKISFGAEQI